MSTLTKQIFYNFDVDNQIPLDKRFIVKSVNELHIQEKRYFGMLFFVESEAKYYTYNQNLQPVLLSSLINSGTIFGINVADDYTNLLTDLGIGQIGKLVTVFPLGVTFNHDGTKWIYHSGKYKTSNFNSIPEQLREPYALVDDDEYEYIITPDKTLSDYIIIFEEGQPLINKRYYKKTDNNLYYALDDVLWKVGNKSYISTVNIEKTNEITHNLNSTYVSVFLWINNKMLPILDYQTTLNTVTFESYLKVPDCTIIINTL